MTPGQLTLHLAPPGDSGGQERRPDAIRDTPCGRPGCGRPVGPQARGGDPKVFCSDNCRRAHWEAQNPRVKVAPKNQRKKGPTNADRVLDRLRQGRATGLDLLRAGGGTRYGARIHDLRDLGVEIIGPLPWKRPDGSICEDILPKTEDGWDQYELKGA